MADVGLGLARVDLVPGRQEYRLGDEIKGKLIVHSGSVDQRIDVIYLHLKMDAKQGTPIHHKQNIASPSVYPITFPLQLIRLLSSFIQQVYKINK